MSRTPYKQKDKSVDGIMSITHEKNPLLTVLTAEGSTQQTVVEFKNQTLTEIERFGLSALLNLSDGHANHNAETCFQSDIEAFPSIWKRAEGLTVPEMEKSFKLSFAEVFSLEGLKDQKQFSICPTASNTIDIFAAWAKAEDKRVALIEPTFDNLALILRRRGVALDSLPESYIFGDDFYQLHDWLEVNPVDTLFFVNPNNPTGRSIDCVRLKELIELCEPRGITIVIDACFRFCHLETIDEYSILQNSGVSYVILEDTGKLWPTLDIKASLLCYSEDIAPLMREIYEEIYLCTSNLSLALIESFMNRVQKNGGLASMQQLILERRQYVLKQLAESLLKPEFYNTRTLMSVIWLNISETKMSDLELVKYLNKFSLSILPGRYFYWNDHANLGHSYVRISLLKRDNTFFNSISVLRDAVKDLEVRKVEL